MTVITALITRHCTVHATDSLIVEVEPDGSRRPVETQRTKIVPVRVFRGAMSYWGLAEYAPGRWSTPEWLNARAQEARAHESPQAFAEHVKERLDTDLACVRFRRSADSGIGIHFTAYERIGDYWIPELFQITNWANTEYSNVFADGVRLKRETYGTLTRQPSSTEDGRTDRRLEVHQALHEGRQLIYNNGDPVMFNAVAPVVFRVFGLLARRGGLSDPASVDTHLGFARRTVEFISGLQSEFCVEDARNVGGKPHDLAITPSGLYRSTTGDDRGV